MKHTSICLAAALLLSGGALAQPAPGGRANVVVQPEPSSLMLGITQNGPTQLVSGNIYEGLLRYDAQLRPMPQLAKAWSISEDGLTYTFDLRDDVKWHDGRNFTAADVVFSTDVFLRKTAARFRGILQNVDSITAEGEYRVVFKLKQPFGPFIGAFEVGTAPMIPKHLYDGTDYASNPANNTPVGTGPFKFKRWVRGSYINLEKNKDYYEAGKPYLDEIYWHVIPDAAARAVAYQSGTVDILPGGSIENLDVARVAKLANTCVTDKGWEFFGPMSWMWLNNRQGITANVKFRQAIMYALDRKFALETLWNDYGRVATGPVGSSTRYYSKGGTQYDYDPAKARALIKESGYDGSALRLLPLPYGETWQRWAELVKQNLMDVGVKVDIVATDVAGWNSRLSNWDFDMAFTYSFQYGDPALGVSRNYVSSNIAKGSPFNNVSGYANSEVDTLFGEAAQAKDQVTSQRLYDKLQEKLTADVPVAWLQELIFPTVYRCNVKDLVTSGIGLNDGFKNAYIQK